MLVTCNKIYFNTVKFLRGREVTYYELPPVQETILTLKDFKQILKEIE